MAKTHNASFVLREFDSDSDWELSEDEHLETEEDGEPELVSPCTPLTPLKNPRKQLTLQLWIKKTCTPSVPQDENDVVLMCRWIPFHQH